MTGPTAAVVVVNWNGADVLEPCLASLRPAVAAGAEVVVVDNASTDGSPDLVARVLPGARLVRRATNDGFAAGVTAGVAATAADVVLLLNNDAVAAPGWLAAMLAPFSGPGADDLGAVTGRVLYVAAHPDDENTRLLAYLANARIIKAGLEKAGLRCFGGTNAPYVWARTPKGTSSWDFFDFLLSRAHVVTTPGSGFGPSGEGYIRLSAFGKRKDTERAVERIQAALRK